MFAAALALCSALIATGDRAMCVVSPLGQSSGFLAEGPDVPTCTLALHTTSGECLSYAPCEYLGGVIAGCYELPGGVNHLFLVPDPFPGEILFVSFSEAL